MSTKHFNVLIGFNTENKNENGIFETMRLKYCVHTSTVAGICVNPVYLHQLATTKLVIDFNVVAEWYMYTVSI